MACQRNTLIGTMIAMAIIGLLLGISIGISPFLIQHSASYVDRHEIDRVMKLVGAYPLSMSEPRFRRHLGYFDGCPRKIENPDTTVLAMVAMFDDLGYPSRFNIPRRNLISFILHIKEGYKDVPYHNWIHGFSAAHFAYLLTKELGLKKILSDSRAMAFLIAALSHDIGHPGTTSNFQKLTNSLIAKQFEAPSLLEKYHLNLTRQVLEIHENDILTYLSPSEKEEVYDTLEDVILATDIVQHISLFKAMSNLTETGLDTSNPHQVSLLLSMMTVAFDLCDQTKEFDNVVEVAYLICKEFYAQGVRERWMGIEPDAWMDPERANAIVDQRKFVENVAQPLFQLLQKLFPDSQGLSSCVSTIDTNLQRWIAFQTALEASNLPREGVPIDVLKNDELLTQAEEIYLSRVNKSTTASAG